MENENKKSRKAYIVYVDKEIQRKFLIACRTIDRSGASIIRSLINEWLKQNTTTT